MEAVEHHHNHMHECLLQLIRKHVSVHLNIPEGTKLWQAEHSSVGKYKGSSKFGDLEKWLTDLVILFEVSMYGGEDRDKERVLSTLEFLDGEARKWYHRHVINVHRACLRWTFEEVIMGLYDRFVQPSTMQDAHKEFLSASYNTATGIQGYYNILMDHAQNMVIYPDDYQIMERFLNGITDDIWEKVFDCSLSPEVNTIDDLVACAKAIEITKKTVVYYCKRTPMTTYSSPRVAPCRTTMATKPKEVTYTHHPRFESKSREPRRKDDNRRHAPRPTAEKVHGEAPRAYDRPKLQHPPRAPDDRRRPSQPAAGACFNCGKVGHFAADCLRPKQSRDHVRVVRTEVPEDGQNPNEDDPPSHQEDGYDLHESYQGGDVEEVKVDVYNNDYYLWTTDDDALAVMTEMPADKVHSGKRNVKMRRAVMTVSKESCPRPTFPPNMKECLATFMKVGGQEAWTLWNSGSTMTGITPSFVDVAKITVFPLKNPYVLQLRTVDSCASINFGLYIDVAMHGSLQQEYVDVANFDHYDMIIGTPFMRSRKVILDFENDTIKIGNQLIPATKVLVPDTNDRVRRYCATEKNQE